MWVKDLTLNKLHRSNLFYVTVYFFVIGNRGMWACIISENNNWRMFLFLCHENEGNCHLKLASDVGVVLIENFRLQS